MQAPQKKPSLHLPILPSQVEQVLSSLFARANLEKPSFSILPLHALLHNLALKSVPSLCAAEMQLDTDKCEWMVGWMEGSMDW